MEAKLIEEGLEGRGRESGTTSGIGDNGLINGIL